MVPNPGVSCLSSYEPRPCNSWVWRASIWRLLGLSAHTGSFWCFRVLEQRHWHPGHQALRDSHLSVPCSHTEHSSIPSQPALPPHFGAQRLSFPHDALPIVFGEGLEFKSECVHCFMNPWVGAADCLEEGLGDLSEGALPGLPRHQAWPPKLGLEHSRSTA